MKIKSIAILFCVISLSYLFFTSCHNDDNSDVDDVINKENSMIVGTWAEGESREQFIFTFLENGTGYLKVVDNKDNSSTVDAFYYSFDPKTMTIKFDDDFTGINDADECSGTVTSIWTVDIKAGLQMKLTNKYTSKWGIRIPATGECKNMGIHEGEDTWKLLKQDDTQP